MNNPNELVAYEVIAQSPFGGAPELLDAGQATRAELAEEQARIPANAAVEYRIYPLQ